MDQNETWHRGRPPPRTHCVTDPAPPPKKRGHSPQILAHVRCGQTARWIKMPLGIDVGLGLGDFVLDGGHSSLQKGAQTPIFGACPLWPNGWIDQDATRYGGRLQTRLHCVRCGPSSPNGKGHSSPLLYGQCLLWPNGRLSQQLLSFC